MVDQSTNTPSISIPIAASDNICRVCRSEGSSEKPLYYPCVCTGSIKYIHQDCLVQWLKYSKKEYCELCNHPFSFAPVYSPDMPNRLPLGYLLMGLIRSISKAVRFWFHYTLVAIAWLIFVPLTACRIYRLLFTSLTLNDFFDVFSSSDILIDSFSGCFVVICTLSTFVSIIWLREQILLDGGPAWLGRVVEAPVVVQPEVAPVEVDVPPVLAEPIPRVVPPVEQVEVALPPVPADVVAPLPAPVPADAVAPAPVAADDDDVAPAEAEAVPAEQNGNADEQANNNNEDHWNLLDFERAAEDVSWERLLGLDGSLIFLEHVFWIVSMNSSFIVIFAFVPYQIGLFSMYLLNITEKLAEIKFHSFLTSLFGYLMIAILLVIILTLFSLTNKTRAKRLVGISYMIVKVSLLIIVDFGLFPLICGWWLDICSLSLFSDSFKDRLKSFDSSPMAFVFIRWLIGMIYVFYFASFILLLREVIRPGVLFFIRNINDPNFNPIQEMIHIPIYRHIRRFLASIVVFGSIVVLMLWLPIKSIKSLFPAFLPYHVRVSSDSPVHELSLELLLLQVILPAILEQGYTRSWLKNLVKIWCIGMSWLLGLRSYLLGDQVSDNAGQEDKPEEAAAAAPNELDNLPQEEPIVPAPNQIDPLVPGEAPAVPDHAPLVPELAPIIPDNAPLAPVQDPLAPGQAPLIPGQAPLAPDQALLAPGQAPLAPGPDPLAPGQAPLAPGQDPLAPGQAPLAPGQDPLANLSEEMRARLQRIQNNIRAVRENVIRLERDAEEPEAARAPAEPIILLCVFICTTLFISSTLSLIVPVFIGRNIMSLWMGNAKILELYTCSCGLYTLWVVLRVATIVYRWVPQGWPILGDRIRLYGIIALKTLSVAFFIMGIIPLMIGQLLDFTVLSPIRVPFDQNPIHRPWQNWALGVLHMKLLCVCIMVTQSIFYRELEQIYDQGFRRMDIKFIFQELCFPVIRALTYALSIPYIISYTILPMFGMTDKHVVWCQRIIYPLFLCIFAVIMFCVFQAKQFRNLYEHIKNDRYLVGKQLVNYDKRPKVVEK